MRVLLPPIWELADSTAGPFMDHVIWPDVKLGITKSARCTDLRYYPLFLEINWSQGLQVVCVTSRMCTCVLMRPAIQSNCQSGRRLVCILLMPKQTKWARMSIIWDNFTSTRLSIARLGLIKTSWTTVYFVTSLAYHGEFAGLVDARAFVVEIFAI